MDKVAVPDPEEVAIPRWLPAIFFLSGFAALIYQIAWQRSLFLLFGIHIESVTVIVSAFMLGLGLGSLWGGRLSRRRPGSALILFGAIELGIGAFGFLSLLLFDAVGEAALHAPGAVTALATFLILLVPTLLMGATLPLLVAWAVARTKNVGRSVGALYAVNTLGSAAASVATAIVLFPLLGLSSSVFFAAGLNLLVSALAFREARL